MALPIFDTLRNRARISLVLSMQVGGVSQYRGYSYMGLLPYAVAKSMPGHDVDATVAATRAYFRPGSDTSAAAIDYVILQKDGNSPMVVIPEPLVNDGSVELVNSETHVIRVNGEWTKDQISTILSANGIDRFTINTEVT